MHASVAWRNRSFTMRSSPEWYDSTATRPPGTVASSAASIASGSTVSSLLTSIRMAWNVRLAGWPPVRRAGAGMAPVITAASAAVDSSGRAATMAVAIRCANRSSP